MYNNVDLNLQFKTYIKINMKTNNDTYIFFKYILWSN